MNCSEATNSMLVSIKLTGVMLLALPITKEVETEHLSSFGEAKRRSLLEYTNSESVQFQQVPLF